MARKIAICVGQDKYATTTNISSLNGCVNDAILIGVMLRFAGFQEIRQIHNEAATQEGILRRLTSEIAKLRKGDYFVFWNSSHGYQVQDRNGDELLDGCDEAICTYDNDPRNPLTDDKFAGILSRANPEAFIFFGSDSCHSGTLTKDVQKVHSQGSARLWIPPQDILFRSGQAIIDLKRYIEGFKQEAPSLASNELCPRRFGRLASRQSANMNHVLLSGCKADEISWDAHFSQGYHGAMTYHFSMAVLQAWNERRSITYRDAHAVAMQGLRKDKFEQTPQLEGPNRLTDTPVFGFNP